ncbi:MAG TPA: hypothetical protein VMU39_19760 [Solirubrobacteraceae bacterium]|nr:hypothetical protein [Solirubrobacteraceae bacterium]
MSAGLWRIDAGPLSWVARCLVMELSTARNIALASLRRLRRAGLLSSKIERSFASEWARRLQVTIVVGSGQVVANALPSSFIKIFPGA